MHDPDPKTTLFVQNKQADFLREAKQQHMIQQYLRATRDSRTWRFRIAETLLGLAVRLSPYHCELLKRALSPQKQLIAP